MTFLRSKPLIPLAVWLVKILLDICLVKLVLVFPLVKMCCPPRPPLEKLLPSWLLNKMLLVLALLKMWLAVLLPLALVKMPCLDPPSLIKVFPLSPPALENRLLPAEMLPNPSAIQLLSALFRLFANSKARSDTKRKTKFIMLLLAVLS